MIQCKQTGCPDGKNICCKICPDKADCGVACTDPPETCGNSVFQQESGDSAALIAFRSGAAAVIQAITDISKAKAAIEAREKDMRTQLEKAMQDYGIDKFDTDDLSVTFVPASQRTTVDGKKLKAKFPGAYAACTKTSAVKASVRIKLKEGEET